jgi:hypothetical protein
VPSLDCIQVLTFICVLNTFCQVCVIVFVQLFLRECMLNTCCMNQVDVAQS